MELLFDQMDSAIGKLLIVSDGKSLCALDYEGYEDRMHRLLRSRYPQFQLTPCHDPIGCRESLQAYFNGEIDALDQIPVSLGGTPFQQQVWSALRTIPPGTVISYGELARRIDKPTAYRAVGMTNGLNPVAIVVPCHRVIGTNTKLTGYAGGLERKRWLLQHEGYKQLELTL